SYRCVTHTMCVCVCVCVCAVELPPDDDGMEACSGTLVWEHCDPQTSRADTSHCTIHRFSCQRGNTHTHTHKHTHTHTHTHTYTYTVKRTHMQTHRSRLI